MDREEEWPCYRPQTNATVCQLYLKNKNKLGHPYVKQTNNKKTSFYISLLIQKLAQNGFIDLDIKYQT